MAVSENKHLIVIAGPTAVGKTELSFRLAKELDTEIVSADSRQFYKEMNIGTAKPPEAYLNAVPHHFINSLPVTEDYNIARYEEEALKVLESIFSRKNTAILTGGSGLYLKAVCEGLDEVPPPQPEIRRQLEQEFKTKGIGVLQKELKKCDPDYYRQADLNNHRRLIRALEVCRATGKPFSAYRKQQAAPRPFTVIKTALYRERETLYNRINRRMDQMLETGLFEEAQSLYPYKNCNALRTVGYQEIFDYMDGKQDWPETIRLLKRNSRRYAKRQLTWLRRDPDMKWFHADEADKLDKFVINVV